MKVYSLAFGLSVVLCARSAMAQEKHALTFDDFAAIRGVSDPQVSPDGNTVLYAVRTADVAANRRTTKTYLLAVAGGAPKVWPADDVSATEARYSPDGKRVAYIAGGQLWLADASGANRRQITSLNGGATGPVWSPASDRIAFTSTVYPACTTDACNAARDKAAFESKVKAHIADELLYRHWTAWDDGTRSHLFVVAADGSPPKDLMPGARYDVPPAPFGGSEAYAWSPDGRELAYTTKDQGRANAWSTDFNLYLVPAEGGASRVITAENKGADANPVYSPDGRFIAYQSQARAGFESDRFRLMFYDRASRRSREVLSRWDRDADGYFFAPDSHAIYVTTTDASRDKLYRVMLDAGGNAGVPQLVIGEHNNAGFDLSSDGHTIVWLRDATDRPAEVWTAPAGDGAPFAARALTHENDALVARLDLHPAEDFWFTGAAGAKVQGFVIKPPDYQPGRKYPVVLLIHGGPQGAWLDQWHGRWNYQMFAAPGFGLVVINPRGSFGYGQKFVDEISRDWGGKVYTDLMNGLDAALAKNPWMDSTRMGAAGGSFGGYMVDWIEGHSRRFKALVSHAGPYNFENMYGATEELWFPEWEYGGPFWNSKAMAAQYRKFSPHLFARNFRTPALVTGGELDFRVPYTEDLSFFTALQRQNVPSRLVIFPDEGHWIGKPQDQQLWWREVQGWLSRYLRPVDKA